MEVKIKKCELNFKNTREKIVMEVTFQKTNEAVDIRDFLCMAMKANKRLHVEFSKGEYRVTDKTATASTDACAILEQLPAILQTFMNFNVQDNERRVPDTNSKPSDMEIKGNKEGNIDGKDQGSETNEEHRKIPQSLAKEHIENRDPDSEICKETKETKIEAVSGASTSSFAHAPKQEDSRDFKAPQTEDTEKKSLAFQGSDNSQTAIRSSCEDHPKTKDGTAGVQSEEIASLSVSLEANIKTDESKSNKEGEMSKQDPNSSSFEALQGEGKAEKPGARPEMDISDTSNKPDESIHTSASKMGYPQAKKETVPMQAQSTSGESSGSDRESAKCARDPEPAKCARDSEPAKCARDPEPAKCARDLEPAKCARDPEPAAACTGDTKSSNSGTLQMKEKADKSGDIEATEQSVSNAQASISGASQAQKRTSGLLMQQDEGNNSSLTNAKGMKMTKYGTQDMEKLSLPRKNPYDPDFFL